jgi:hypothetical protein
LYIPIHLLPVLFTLIANEEIKSIDGLDKFRQRHLQNEQNLRSAIFVKLLIALDKRPYEQEKANKKIQLELDNLAEVPIVKAGQSHIVEIIPYEALWEILANRP